MKKSDTQEPEVITEVVTLTPFESEVIALQEFVKDYDNYPVTEETYKEALKARAAVRDKRYSIDKTLKANNDVLNKLKGGQKTKAEKLYEIVCPVEEKLDAGIKAIENKREEVKAQKAREEEERLAKIEEEKRLAMEAELKAEKDRLEAIRIEQVAKEQELAQKEAELFKKHEDDRKEAEAKFLEKQLAAQAEIDKANAELKAKEEAHQKRIQEDLDRKRKEQEEIDARLRAKEEAIEREKKEIQDKKDRELAEKEAEEERLQQEEEERLLKIEEDKRQEALRPDKEKLLAFAEMIGAVEYPELSGEQQSKVILEQVQATVIGLQVWIKKAVETI